MRKLSNKIYCSSGYIIVKGKTLLAACATQSDILDFVKTNNIRIPKKAWWAVTDGVTYVETRPVYALDSRQFKGFIMNDMEENDK